MPPSRVVVVGLGPGPREQLTVAALDALRSAERLYVPASVRATIAALRGDLHPGARIQVVDDLIDRNLPPEQTWAHIADVLLAAAGTHPITYAVPGHPSIDDRSVPLLLAGATARGFEVSVVAGLSLADAAMGSLRIDMRSANVQVVDADDLASVAGDEAAGLAPLWTGPSSRLLNAQLPVLIVRLVGEEALRAVASRFLERYPAEHEVKLVSWIGTPKRAVLTLRLARLGSAGGIKPAYPAALYVPALDPIDDTRALTTLGYITARLRGPGGCQWDREQKHSSLTSYMIEEAYEVVDAIESGDTPDLVEELGDVLLQVVLHSQLAEEEGTFSLADVTETVSRKLVRRHPHVFGDVSVSGSADVLRNWEKIKRAEKGARRASALDGIPPALPALAQAQIMGRKAAKMGFDWPDAGAVLDKIGEEFAELRNATTAESRRDEMGDLLFALTSVCRHLGLDAEETLRAAVRKFQQRFRRVEAYAQERSLDLTALDPAELDALWEESKALDKAG